MNSVNSIDYSKPIKTKKTHDAAALNPVNEKIAKCYAYVDQCKNNSTNADIACEYKCCDEN
jgi:hypothetical protein